MIQRKTLYHPVLNYFLYLMLALLFAAIFHFCISPVVTEEAEFDVSCFHVIGNAMRFGKMPYLDFIDNKGPVQYFVYMLGASMFKFPWGIFIISVILDFCSLVILDHICKRLQIRHSFWVLILYLFFYVCVCSNGGFTEDFSLPLTLAAFLVYLDFDESIKNNRFRIFTGFLLGLLFWLCAFTRINNALSIGLITASIGVQLLWKKEFKKVALFVGSFTVGTLIVVIPIFLWLYQNGAWQEFLDQFLLNNFKYSSAEDAISKVDLFFHNRFGKALFYLVFEGLLGSYLLIHRCGKAKLSIFITTLVVLIGTAASFVSMTKSFPHYLLVILIPAFFGFILMFAFPGMIPDKNRKKNGIMIAIITFFCCVGMIFTFSGKLKVQSGLAYTKAVATSILNGTVFQKTEYEQTMDRLAEHIPQNERNSVFPIDANTNFFAYTGITPCKRMFVCKSLFTGISTTYYDEFVSYFSIDPPKWLITEEPIETIDLCGMEDEILSTYSLVDDTTGYYYLYMRSVINENP